VSIGADCESLVGPASGTDGSNPLPSSVESANPRSRLYGQLSFSYRRPRSRSTSLCPNCSVREIEAFIDELDVTTLVLALLVHRPGDGTSFGQFPKTVSKTAISLP
jgi:hypothetical protein